MNKLGEKIKIDSIAVHESITLGSQSINENRDKIISSKCKPGY